ncbi:MAG: WYL domain-containing protein [Eubacteriales bacterium]|nr:WYL domain-containing protein [Eubacteriales bacterium]
MLFHEIYSSYYLTTAAILREAVRGTLTGRKMTALVQEHAFGESLLTIPDSLKTGKWKLLRADLSTPLTEAPSMPLTTLEKRWMKALLLDPRIRLFEPDEAGLADVEPLFTPDRVVYYDRYTDGDDYRNPAYIRHFRTILRALREERDLYVRFETKLRAPQELVVTPHQLEYSEKDDRFRLIAAGRKRRWIINVARITECRPARKDEHVPQKKAAPDSVTFELEDRRNALERVLLHFSHLEKETKRLGEDRYLVTLKYDRQDETEMVIRILSFGPVIQVIEPAGFIALIKERIEKQRRLCRGI